jgi:hypothetical protein
MNSRHVIAAMTLVISAMQTDGGNMTPFKTVSGTAERTARAPGAPKCSDVCFSSRRMHPGNAQDPHDTFRDATAFHATRLDWVYSANPAWITECKSRGYWFGGALNTILTDAPGKKTREQGRILDKDGRRIAAPWMQSWNGYWGCINSPQYRETFIAHAKLLIDGGADAIQMDDPGINFSAIQWGGCYCEHCRKKAAQQGKTLPEDMPAFQTDSLKESYAFVRKEIDRHAKRRVPWSSNNYEGRRNFPYDLFDYGMAELPQQSGKPADLCRKFAEAARLGRQQVFTFVSTNVPLTRRVIATAYACGGHIIVPYDVYNHDNPRIFGKPEEYADIYGFVRANAAFLDGYEDAAVSGKGLAESRYGASQPVELDVDGVFAFVRAQPGKPDAPVAVHLVDWREAPQPFWLKLKTACFFGAKPIESRLSVPPPFDRDVNARASKQTGYSSLAKEQVIPTTVNGESTDICLPMLNPWGILILNPKEK